MSDSPKHQVEALLFSSGKSMTLDQLVELSKLEKGKVSRALKAIKKEYEDRDGAIEIVQDGNSWKMTVRNEHLLLVKNIVADTELSRACMETLAVVAYKYPDVLQSDIIETRGGGAYEHIKELESLGFLRKESSGRSYKIKLTEKFFDYFDIAGEKNIRDVFKNTKMPDPKEIQRELGEMQVVPVEERKNSETGELEVVDVSEEPEKPDIPQEESEESEENDKKEEKETLHNEFLDDLDRRIEAISSRNDSHAEDPLLQREAEDVEEDREPEKE